MKLADVQKKCWSVEGATEGSWRVGVAFAIRCFVNRAAASVALQNIRLRLVAFKLKYRLHLAIEAMSAKVGLCLIRQTIRLARVRKRLRSDFIKDVVLDIDLEISKLAVFFFNFAEAVEHRRVTLPHVLHRVDQVANLGIESVPHLLVDVSGNLPDAIPDRLRGGDHAIEDTNAFINSNCHRSPSRSVVGTTSVRQACHLRKWWGGGATRDHRSGGRR